ncbi:hypothetical protein X801_05456, partial [Opisthorchis viverrini]
MTETNELDKACFRRSPHTVITATSKKPLWISPTNKTGRGDSVDSCLPARSNQSNKPIKAMDQGATSSSRLKVR